MICEEVIVNKNHWNTQRLFDMALSWYYKARVRLHAVSVRSNWWVFVSEWPRICEWLNKFNLSNYQFSPMKQYPFTDETVQAWS